MSLKHDLLFELELNRGADSSGQKLAEKLGVSRNAIWKTINLLKKDGYEILSSTNKGYRLADGSDLLSAEGIKGYLSGKAKELPVFYFKTIDSTNSEAKRKLAAGLRGDALIVSECQTQGHGRNGHAFYSPSTGAYMTLVLHLDASLENTVCITAATAVAVIRAIEALTDKKPKIKWVNDIFLNGRKIAGILTEAITSFEEGTVQCVIIGIGINVKPTDFPQEIKNTATSLEPSGVTRNQIAAEVTNRLLQVLGNLSDRSFLDDYREHSMVIGKEIDYYKDNKVYRATAIGISDNGGLIIQNGNGTREVIQNGNISIRPDGEKEKPSF